MTNLTPRQATRLQNLIASGPLDRTPVDTELIGLGWAQEYDGSDAIEATDAAAQRLYDSRGQIKAELLPVEWHRPEFAR
jgi:hypothetical protein